MTITGVRKQQSREDSETLQQCITHLEELSRNNSPGSINAIEVTMRAMAMIVEARDPCTTGHQHRVAKLACAIATEMGFTPDEATGLKLGGLVHDIGKAKIPSDILTKEKGLTEAEWNIIQVHPVLGCDMLKTLNLPWPVAEIVVQHHEKINGSGYPAGLVDNDILLEARVLAVADAVEAMCSHRSYRPAYSLDGALSEISRQKNSLYDADVVDACVKLFAEHNFSFQ